ncbi:hypothetical protein [Pseudomonas sp. Marseille-QA0892]
MTTPAGPGTDVHHPNDIEAPPGTPSPTPTDAPVPDAPAQEIPGDDVRKPDVDS